MSVPTTFEFAVIQVGDGATPTEVFQTLCGIQTTGFNRTVQSSDRFVRDCTNPALVPVRKVRVTGRQWDLTGSGLYNVDQEIFDALLGKKNSYRYRIMDIDGDNPVEIGTWAGRGVMTSANMGTSENDDGTIEVSIASDGAWVYTAAA